MIEQRFCTPEELLTLPNNDLFELVDGELVEKSMGGRSSWITANLIALLGPFVRANRLGHLLGSEASYQLSPDRPRTIRKPDISFIRRGRLEDERIPEGHIPLAPDLAVEVVSPNDLAYEVENKRMEYLEVGVQEVWIIYPPTEVIMTFSASQSLSVLHGEDQLQSSNLLPGFSCRVADVFTDEPIQNDQGN